MMQREMVAVLRGAVLALLVPSLLVGVERRGQAEPLPDRGETLVYWDEPADSANSAPSGSETPAAEQTPTSAPHDDPAHSESQKAEAGEHATTAGGQHADEHGGDHHDPYDLGHANAASQLEDPGEFRTDLAIWTFGVFLVLMLLLAKFAWGPIIAGLDQREKSIADMINQARVDGEQAKKQLQAYEQKLVQAGEEAREIIEQARITAEKSGAKIVADAQAEADRQLTKAKADITAATNQAIQEIANQSVNTAVALAGRMIGRELKADDHGKLIREALDQFPSKN